MLCRGLNIIRVCVWLTNPICQWSRFCGLGCLKHTAHANACRQELDYWTSKLNWADVLHVLFLGCARDFVTSVVKLLLYNNHFPGSCWKDKLHNAFCKFVEWCKSFGFRPHTDKFDLESVRGYDTICSKAFDVKLLMGWISHETLSFNNPNNAELVQVSCYCLARWGVMVFCGVESLFFVLRLDVELLHVCFLFWAQLYLVMLMVIA